jgi:hypothetical protein
MQRPFATLLEEGGHTALPSECVERIEERLKWAEEVCRGSWTPTKDSSTSQATHTVRQNESINSLLFKFRNSITAAAVSGIFFYTAGYYTDNFKR